VPLPTFNTWDYALIAVVTVQSGILAYLHDPRWKALILTLPVPFTMAVLALNRPVDATNAAAFVNLALFIAIVRLAHAGGKGLPVVASIILATLVYCASGLLLAGIIPATAKAFWLTSVLMGLVGAGFFFAMPYRVEPGHGTPLAQWIKLPVIAAVIIVLIVIKHNLKGFLTAFPMVTIIGCYEARHSLWTMNRQIALLIMVFVPVLAAMYFVQQHIGVRWSLAAGWAVYLVLMAPILRSQWTRVR